MRMLRVMGNMTLEATSKQVKWLQRNDDDEHLEGSRLAVVEAAAAESSCRRPHIPMTVRIVGVATCGITTMPIRWRPTKAAPQRPIDAQ